jgi:hypothetical protein
LKHVAIAAALLVWAGAGVAQSTVEAVYAIESAYAAALTLAIEYAAQPRCGGAAASGACSEAAMVERLRVVDAVATSALRGAQLIARDPGASAQTAEGSLRVAREAVGVFDALVRSLKR